MNRRLLTALLGLLLGGYLFAVWWTGSNFASYASHPEPLSLDAIEPLQARVGEPMALEITGSGFNADMELNLVMDFDHRDGIVKTLPIPGDISDMQLSGDRLLLGNLHQGVQVLDVSNPVRPRFLYQSGVKWPVHDIEAMGERFLLSCGDQGIKILRLTDDSLYLEGSIHWPGIIVESKFYADHLYVSTGNDGYLVYDLTPSAEPRLVQHAEPSTKIHKMIVHDGFLFVLLREKGLYIYDLKDPAAPKKIKHFKPDRQVLDMDIFADDLFLLEDKVGVRRYQLTNPADPRYVNDYQVYGKPTQLSVSDQYILAHDASYGLQAIPRRSFSDTRSIGQIHLYTGGGKVVTTLISQYFYASMGRDNLAIIDPRQAKSSLEIKPLTASGDVQDLIVDGRWLYFSSRATDGKGGGILDLDTNTLVARLDGGNYLHLAENKKTLYLSGSGRILAFDVADPTRARQILDFESPFVRNVFVSGALLVAASADGVRLYDLQPPESPRLLDNFPLKQANDVLSIVKGIVYVTANQQGLVGLTITKEKTLQQLFHLEPPWPMNKFSTARHLLRQGDTLYMTNGEAGLSVLDIADPRRPKVVKMLNLPGFANALSSYGQELFVSSHQGGLHFIDIRKPHRPKLVTTIRRRRASGTLLFLGEAVFLADPGKGIRVMPAPVKIAEPEVINASRMKLQIPPVKYPGRYSIQVSNKREQAALEGVVNYLPGSADDRD